MKSIFLFLENMRKPIIQPPKTLINKSSIVNYEKANPRKTPTSKSIAQSIDTYREAARAYLPRNKNPKKLNKPIF